MLLPKRKYDDSGWNVDEAEGSNGWLPKNLDLRKIISAVNDHNLSCAPDQEKLFSEQLSYVQSHYHINLSAVYIPDDTPTYLTLFRDIADYVSHYQPGTIIVFNKKNLGLESDAFSLDIIESSANSLKLNHPEEVIITYGRNLASPHLSWNLIVPITFVLILVVVIGVQAFSLFSLSGPKAKKTALDT